MNKKYITIITGIILVVVAGGIYWWQRGDALLVQSPSDTNELWKTLRDEKSGEEFQYPENLLTKYIGVHEWPPKLGISESTWSCKDEEFESGGKIIKREIRKVDNDRIYCRDSWNGAAAGTTYANYAYRAPNNNFQRTITFEFALRYPNCGNYEEPQRKECEAEREAFDLDGVVNRMFSSLSLIKRQRAKLYENCARTEFPRSDDSSFDPAERIYTIHYWDEKLQDNAKIELPYEPETGFAGCSESAKSILRHIQETVIPQ